MQVHRRRYYTLNQLKEPKVSRKDIESWRPKFTWPVLIENKKDATKPSPAVLTGAKRRPGQLKWSKNPSHSLKRQKDTVDFVCFILWITFLPLSVFKRFFFFFQIARNWPYAFSGFSCNNMVFWVCKWVRAGSWKIRQIVQSCQLGDRKELNKTSYFLSHLFSFFFFPLWFDSGYSAINLVTYVYQNVKKKDKNLFKNIFRKKTWCVSVDCVKILFSLYKWKSFGNVSFSSFSSIQVQASFTSCKLSI